MFHTKEVSGLKKMKIRVWAKRWNKDTKLIIISEEHCKMPVEYWREFEEQQMSFPE